MCVCALCSLAWIAFFFSFIATFAPAALMPVIRETLTMDKWQVGMSGNSSVQQHLTHPPAPTAPHAHSTSGTRLTMFTFLTQARLRSWVPSLHESSWAASWISW